MNDTADASWYHAQSPPPAAQPALQGTVDCDVAVVGGGIAGCSTALHLAERGYRVVLLEAERIGHGASGRSGAQALAGVACGQENLERLLGADDAHRIFEVTREGLRLQRDLIATHRIECEYVTGTMQVATRARQDRELQREFALLTERCGHDSLRLMERDEVRTTIASERYTSALYDAAGGHLQPLAYVRGLARAAMAQGARIFEHTRALAHARHVTASGESALTLRTPGGEVRCRHIALCGNAWLGDYSATLARKIIPVGTYVVATESLGAERARALIRNDAAVSDANWVLDYFRLTRDHRLLFGGRVSYSGLENGVDGNATRVRMVRVFPQLADVAITHAWGGWIDITRNRAPHFGRLAPDIHFLQGFSGHGIALAGIAGKLLSEAIDGTQSRFDVFAKIRHHDFPGGAALRRPALVLAMLWYRLRDLL